MFMRILLFERIARAFYRTLKRISARSATCPGTFEGNQRNFKWAARVGPRRVLLSRAYGHPAVPVTAESLRARARTVSRRRRPHPVEHVDDPQSSNGRAGRQAGVAAHRDRVLEGDAGGNFHRRPSSPCRQEPAPRSWARREEGCRSKVRRRSRSLDTARGVPAMPSELPALMCAVSVLRPC